MSERQPGVAAPALQTFVASGFGVFISFATSVVIARTLGAPAKGVFDLAIATAMLLALVLGLALPSGITFAVARGLAAPRRVAVIVLGLAAAQTTIAWLVLSAADELPPLAAVLGTGMGGSAAVLVAGLVGTTALGANLKAIAVGRLRIVLAAWVELGGRVLILFGILVVASSAGSMRLTAAVVIGVVVAASFASALGLGALAVGGAPSGRGLGMRLGLRIALPSYLANVLQFLNYRLDLFLVAAFLTTAAVGVYALAATLGQMVWLVSNALAATLFPTVAAGGSSDPGAGHRTSALSRFALASAIALGLALGVAAIPGVRLLFGDEFDAAVPVLWLLLPGIVVFAPVNVISAHLAGIGRPELNLAASGASLVVTVLLDVVLIPTIGIAGAAIATTCSYVVAAAIIIVMFMHESGEKSLRRILVLGHSDVRLIQARVAGRSRSEGR